MIEETRVQSGPVPAVFDGDLKDWPCPVELQYGNGVVARGVVS